MSTYPAEVGVQVATVVQIEIAALRRDLAAKQLAGDRALALIVERMLNLTGASGAAVASARETEMVCRASAGDAPSVGACIDPTLDSLLNVCAPPGWCAATTPKPIPAPTAPSAAVCSCAPS